MQYQSPGGADNLSAPVSAAWNDMIRRNYEAILSGQVEQHGGAQPLFSMDPSALQTPSAASVTWPGSPAEPEFCRSKVVARELSDWGPRGRHAVQNEYCEYAVLFQADGSGKMRPKRVEISTELR